MHKAGSPVAFGDPAGDRSIQTEGLFAGLREESLRVAPCPLRDGYPALCSLA